MNDMFNSCKALSSLDLSSFDTSNVQFMNRMFTNCISLKSLNLSNFNTPEVLGLVGMFKGCTALTSLDISSFDLDSVRSMENFVADCSNLEYFKIKLGNVRNGFFLLFVSTFEDLIICTNDYDKDIFEVFDEYFLIVLII